ncbi:MAG: hypothetical protein U0Z70_19275 [Thermomicrobiales bacterium]
MSKPELPDRFQHPVARFVLWVRERESQAAIDQCRKELQELQLGLMFGSTKHASCRERAASGKRSHLAKERLSLGGEKLVAPINRHVQALVPDRPVPWTIDQEPEPVFETGIDGGQGEVTQAGRRQFDGQRQAIERPADGSNVSHIVSGECKRSRGRLRPVHEQANCGKSSRLWRRVSVGAQIRQREGRQRQAVLARDVEHCATCDHDAQRGPRLQQVGKHGRGRNDLLEVVEDEQCVSLREVVGQGRQRRATGGEVDVQRRRNDRRHIGRVLDAGQ